MLDKKILKKLNELSIQASIIKADPKLRHAPNAHDLSAMSENANLMQPYQYQAIKSDGDSA